MRRVVINVDPHLASALIGWLYTFLGGFALGFSVAWFVVLLR